MIEHLLHEKRHREHKQEESLIIKHSNLVEVAGLP